MPLDSFDGKLAFITGGASGIGLGIAKSLVARGAKVVIADLRPDHIDKALSEFSGGAASNAVTALELDVTNRDKYREAAKRMQDEFGGIDILINNAGVGSEGPIKQAGFVDWDFGLGVNLGGVVNGIQCFLPQILAHGRGGHIVNTSSLAAVVKMPGDYIVYAAGKAAVLKLTEDLRGALADDGIGVTALLPGFVKSNIHEAKLNRPEHLQEGSGFTDAEQTLSERESGEDWMEPEEVGEMVAEGILANAAHVITHGHFRDSMEARHKALSEATPPAPFQFPASTI